MTSGWAIGIVAVGRVKVFVRTCCHIHLLANIGNIPSSRLLSAYRYFLPSQAPTFSSILLLFPLISQKLKEGSQLPRTP